MPVMALRRLKKKPLLCRYCPTLRMITLDLGECIHMGKRELIDYICEINTSAKPEFLAGFSEEELSNYLEHLMELNLEEAVVCV